MAEQTEKDLEAVSHHFGACILDAAERWATLEQMRARVASELEVEVEVRLEDVEERVKAFVADGRLVEHEGRFLRDRRSMVHARMAAFAAATSRGTTRGNLYEDGVTPRDVDFLVSEGPLLAKTVAGQATLSLALSADEPFWKEGARAFLVRTLPPAWALPELEPVEAVVLGTLAEEGGWLKAPELQEAMNKGAIDAEHVALGVVETVLPALFNRELVDMQDREGVRFWREARALIEQRCASILHALSFDVDGRTLDEIAKRLGVSVAIADADVCTLVDAGLVVIAPAADQKDSIVRLAEDATTATRAIDRAVAVQLCGDAPSGSSTAVDAQSLIQESASWREKHASELRRANELASWIGRKGFSEADVLAEMRGVVQPAKAKREEFDWTASRIVDQAEKGVIFGEVLALENAIAAVRLEADEAAGEHKSRIKGIEAQIRDLKNAAACNQRVVTVRAYKRTDWDNRKIVVHAADDHRVLAEEELPRGTQREIPTEPSVASPSNGASHVIDKLEKASDEAVLAFAEEMRAKGFKVDVDLTKHGAHRVAVRAEEDAPAPTVDVQSLATELGTTVSIQFRGEEPIVVARPDAPEDPADASLDTSEPGPLATEEARKEHREKRSKSSSKKPKGTKKPAEASAT